MNASISMNRVVGNLLNRKAINQHQAQAAQQHSHQMKTETPEDYLITKRIVSTQQIVKSISEVREIQYIAPNKILPSMVANEWAQQLGGASVFVQHNTLPLFISGKLVLCITAVRLKECDLAINFIAKIQRKEAKKIQTCIADPVSLTETLHTFSNPTDKNKTQAQNFEAKISNITNSANENTPEQLYQEIIIHSISSKASDIHIDYEFSTTDIRIRIDGKLKKICSLSHDLGEALCRHIISITGEDVIPYSEIKRKYAAQIKIGASTEYREFRIGGTCARIQGQDGKDNRTRIDLVIRILNNNLNIPSLEVLGFTSEQLPLINSLARSPDGMCILIGKTGSGKTTTLASIVDIRRNPSICIRTAEDPVEYDIPLVNQNEIVESKITYNDYIAAFMRMDPDVMLIGEIRTKEVMNATYRASLAGQPLYSTLHAPTCVAAFDRIEDMASNFRGFVDNTNALIAQKLIQKTCPHCSTKVTFAEFIEARKNEMPYYGHIQEWFKPTDMIQMRNVETRCRYCSGEGLLGRELVAEIMILNDIIKEFVVSNRQQAKILNKAIEQGFLPMHQIAQQKILSKNLTFDPGFITEHIRPWPKKYNIPCSVLN